MAKKLYDEQNIANIASKIREKTGKTTTYKTSEMPIGIDEAFEAGRQSGIGEMWDIVQNGGERKNYSFAFFFWFAEYIRPNHKVVPTHIDSRNQSFRNCQNLKRVEKEYFDFSQCPRGTSNSQGWTYTFFNDSNLEVVEDIGMNNAYTFESTFGYCPKLHTIECIYPDVDTKFSSAFNKCYNLVYLRVNGTIGQDGFDTRDCTALDKESLISIVNALWIDAVGKTVTLSQSAVNKAFETSEGANDGSTSEEWLALKATRENWTIDLK